MADEDAPAGPALPPASLLMVSRGGSETPAGALTIAP